MPSITDTAIVNMALIELGAKRITSFTDGSKNAGIASDIFDFAVDYTLAAHPWNFAIKRRADVAEKAATPAWGFDHAYTVPADCLKVIAIGKNGYELEDENWQVETDDDGAVQIVTDLDSPIDIKFIFRQTNRQVYSPTFVLALSKCLKWLLARPITGKETIQNEAVKEFQAVITQARTVDGQEGFPEDYGPSTLESVR